MRECPRCHAAAPDGAGFCGRCGAPLAEPRTARRRLATVLFCDIAGSTALGERLDAESVQELMLRYFDEMQTAVERHGGVVEKFIGDAVMAVFGVPSAHEDDALRALRAAAEMKDRLAKLNADIAPRYGASLTVRIGVNTGEVVANDAATPERFVTGDVVNTAARLEAAAGADEILLGQATYELARSAVAVEPLPPISVKGKQRPVAAYRLKEVTPVPWPPRPVRTPIVGRDEELAHLQALFRQSVAHRRAELVMVVGEAGMGKSRLALELQETLGGTASVEVGRCLSYGDAITFSPLAEIVGHVLRLDLATSAADAEARIGSLIDGRAARAVAAGIGVSGAVVPVEDVSWALRRLFERFAATRPLVLIIEDLHWAEDALLDLLSRLALEAHEPVLVLCTARPELLERHAVWPVTIALEPLSPEDAAEIAMSLLTVPEETRQRLIAAAGGNPLFLEELIQFVRERDDGRSLPPALHALLSARLDQLPVAERATLERAAVEGDRFHVGAVLELSPVGARRDVVVSLERLESRRLVYPADAQFPGERAFRFKHTLVRNAAYQSVRKRLRAELHQQYAGWLEDKTRDGPSEQEEILGYHLEQAYRNRAELGPVDPETQALGQRAAGRLTTAGRRSLDLGLHPGAAKLLGRARSLFPSDDPDRDEVLLDLGHAFEGAGALARAEDAFAEVLDLARAKGDRRLELHASLALLNVHSSLDPGLTADALMQAGDAAIPIFSELGDHRGLARAWWLVAWARFKRSRYAASAEAATLGLQHARRAGDRRELGRFLGTIAMGLYWGPVPADDGLRRCDETLRDADGSRAVEAFVLRSRGVLLAMQGRFDEARASVARGAGIHDELGQRSSAAGAAAEAGKIELLAEEPDTAERMLRGAYVALDDIGYRTFRAVAAARLAQALYAQGRLDAAGELARHTLSSAVTDDVFPRVICLAVFAKVLALRNDAAEAEALGRSAVDVAAGTDDLELQGDALSDLAEVLTQAQRPDEAAGLTEAAVARYERKGDVVSAHRERRRARLAALK